MDKKITKENYSQIVEEVRKKASEEDWKKVEAIQMMARMGSLAGKSEMDILEGKSFNEIINNIKKNNEAELKAAKEESDHAEKLTQNFEVVSWTKGTHSDEYGISKKVSISLELKNKMNRDVDAFEGHIFVYDKLQNQLGKFRIKETDVLKANSARKLSYEVSTVNFQNRVQEIYDTKGADLRFKFEATKVLLKDGTTL